MDFSSLLLFPQPQKCDRIPGSFTCPEILCYSVEDDALLAGLLAGKLASPIALKKADPSQLIIIQNPNLEEEEYLLTLSASGIRLEAQSSQGTFRGIQTLWQILENSSDRILPLFRIEDRPVLKRRGFMLDVSRCKVPSMDELFSLIDLLTLLKFNELQLYVEHTFAFAKHSTVWANASPFTAEEIRQVDQYCVDRFIELVPNLNSFGHFERWLRHPPYRALAECPDGFIRQEPFMEKDHGTTLKPNKESLDFMESLYAEYLPNFRSTHFNVGMDEPWELGQGWSQEKVRIEGKGKVYLKHLEGIRNLVEKHGRKMQFWADVLLEEPENAKLLPSSASPIIWGYEADHPFDQQAKLISACGLRFCLAPGTATWRSFSGRWPVAKSNLQSAVYNAVKHSAEGILLTSWGDCGNHQPWATLYPPVFLAAQLAWSGKSATDEIVANAVDYWAFSCTGDGLTKALMALGRLDQVTQSDLPNNSLPWFTLFNTQPKKLPNRLKKEFSSQGIHLGIEYLEDLLAALPQTPTSESGSLCLEEIKLGIDLSTAGLEKALSLIEESRSHSVNSQELLSRFESNWLKRARPGGLPESLDLLTNALPGHRDG